MGQVGVSNTFDIGNRSLKDRSIACKSSGSTVKRRGKQPVSNEWPQLELHAMWRGKDVVMESGVVGPISSTRRERAKQKRVPSRRRIPSNNHNRL